MIKEIVQKSLVKFLEQEIHQECDLRNICDCVFYTEPNIDNPEQMDLIHPFTWNDKQSSHGNYCANFYNAVHAINTNLSIDKLIVRVSKKDEDPEQEKGLVFRIANKDDYVEYLNFLNKKLSYYGTLKSTVISKLKRNNQLFMELKNEGLSLEEDINLATHQSFAEANPHENIINEKDPGFQHFKKDAKEAYLNILEKEERNK